MISCYIFQDVVGKSSPFQSMVNCFNREKTECMYWKLWILRQKDKLEVQESWNNMMCIGTCKNWKILSEERRYERCLNSSGKKLSLVAYKEFIFTWGLHKSFKIIDLASTKKPFRRNFLFSKYEFEKHYSPKITCLFTARHVFASSPYLIWNTEDCTRNVNLIFSHTMYIHNIFDAFKIVHHPRNSRFVVPRIAVAIVVAVAVGSLTANKNFANFF